MTIEGQAAKKAKFYAGFYLRTRKRMRFWGWGNPTPETTERPWAEVGDWLRVAHSLLGTPKSAALPEAQLSVPDHKKLSVGELVDETASSVGKRRFRFVWDRRFVGLVYR